MSRKLFTGMVMKNKYDIKILDREATYKFS